MRKTVVPIVCALAMMALPASALATPGRALTRVAPSAIDASWVQASIQGNLAQVQAAQMALSKTTYQPALALAHAMLVAHQYLLNGSERVATKLGIAIPTAPSATQAAELTTLSALSGRAFANALVADELSGYQQFVALTQQEISQGANLRARAWAGYFLPIAQSNMDLAQSAAVRLGVAS